MTNGMMADELERIWEEAVMTYGLTELLTNLTFRGPCIVIYSYNESQRDALFLRFISQSTLHVSDMSTVHHQEYLNTVYTQ